MRRMSNPAAAIAAWTGPSKPKAKPRRRTGRDGAGMRRAVNEVEEFIATDDWTTAEPKHLVGLYAVLHEKVYGVEPEELMEVWLGAVSAAKRLVEELGMGNAIAFLRFTWKDERQREKKAEGTGQVRRRIGWRLQFVSRALLVDFKRAILAGRSKR